VIEMDEFWIQSSDQLEAHQNRILGHVTQKPPLPMGGGA